MYYHWMCVKGWSQKANTQPQMYIISRILETHTWIQGLKPLFTIKLHIPALNHYVSIKCNTQSLWEAYNPYELVLIPFNK